VATGQHIGSDGGKNEKKEKKKKRLTWDWNQFSTAVPQIHFQKLL
jgi:hypothetical protein